MPLNLALFLVFLVAILLICVTPGPDMLYLVATSLSQGPLAGVVASAGMAIGMLVHTLAVTLGLAAVLAASPVAYEVIKYGGAAYLVYMGVQAWRTRSELGRTPAVQDRVATWRVLWRAMVTNILNPKIILFYLAFLPQFVDAGRGHPTLQLLILGLTFVVVGLLVDSLIGISAGRLGRWLQRRRRADTILNRIAGTVFIALAVRLVV
ncbi:LysE family translocator [Dactylosporangium sp. NPDC051484]|uniref:LysE family translocator n=1 Tax=Dactylosporangium sp. NPDC051484 TaxID=3154942 RepID=UPI00344D7CC6